VTKSQLRKRLPIAILLTVVFAVLEFTLGGKRWNEYSVVGAVFALLLVIGVSIYAWLPGRTGNKADTVHRK
jgi:hypothetical protein